MALIYQADLHPTKLELLARWLPDQDWFQGQVAELTRVAAYRFDDPAGEVGIETMLVRVGDGPIHQVPLTYRGAPLAGGDDWLVGTAYHSVLGQRWVYDACGDPVYVAVLTSVILGHAGQAEEFLEVDGGLERRESTMTVSGSGGQGMDAAALKPSVIRRLEEDTDPQGAALAGTWTGQPTPVPLAYASPR